MTQKAPKLTPEQSFWLSLEMERLDTSWKDPHSGPRTRVDVLTLPVKCNRPHLDTQGRESRDRLLFNAGRYAAGARDATATKAHLAIEKEMNE